MDRRTLLQILVALPALRLAAAPSQMLKTLCQFIVPAEGNTGGAIEAGVPEFIDLLATENPDYQRRLSGGFLWLDAACMARFDHAFLDCSSEQQHAILDLIAYRANAEKDPSLLPGVQFFAFLRDLTLDGFFTSRIGIEYLDYRGNVPLASFPGCPE